MKSLQIEYADKENRLSVCKKIIEKAERNKLIKELRTSLDPERLQVYNELKRALNF